MKFAQPSEPTISIALDINQWLGGAYLLFIELPEFEVAQCAISRLRQRLGVQERSSKRRFTDNFFPQGLALQIIDNPLCGRYISPALQDFPIQSDPLAQRINTQ